MTNQLATPSPSKEQIKELVVGNVKQGVVNVKKNIDSFTSAKLKRVLKAITCVHAGEHLLFGQKTTLMDDELNLIDGIFKLQEDINGLYAILQEEEGEKENE